MIARTNGLAVAAALLAVLLTGCKVAEPAVSVPAQRAPSAAEDRPPATADVPDSPGKAAYDRYCAACHGADGVAVASDWTPNLNSQGLLTVVDDQFLYDSTVLGRPGENGRGKPGTKMSAFGDIMSEADLRAVVAYMRAWQTEPSQALAPFTADGDAEAGRRIYEVTCTACHGPDGWGDLAPRLAGESFQRTYSDALIRHVILHGRPGTRMPPHLLSDEELNDLVTFVRTLGREAATPPASP